MDGTPPPSELPTSNIHHTFNTHSCLIDRSLLQHRGYCRPGEADPRFACQHRVSARAGISHTLNRTGHWHAHSNVNCSYTDILPLHVGIVEHLFQKLCILALDCQLNCGFLTCAP
mmetsp:Transcript_26055/g.69497  ORF Transcript_26055/g.69497 Transcript_26055/m.69497 type:complete len:115 (+) Transcript_26055:115-459(+)